MDEAEVSSMWPFRRSDELIDYGDVLPESRLAYWTRKVGLYVLLAVLLGLFFGAGYLLLSVSLAN